MVDSVRLENSQDGERQDERDHAHFSLRVRSGMLVFPEAGGDDYTDTSELAVARGLLSATARFCCFAVQ